MKSIIYSMKYFLFVLLSVSAISVFSQQQTYDLITFTPPPGWTKKVMENSIVFSTTDQVKRTWAQVLIVKSTESKGSIENDFVSEWNEFAVRPHNVSAKPLETDAQMFNGWNLFSGMSKFFFNGDSCALLLNTFSNKERCITFIIKSNTTIYGPILDEFIASISLPPATQSAENSVTPTPSNSSVSDGFHFTTTNFEDGWSSTVQEDWVEATKGNIRVLLHYPRKEDGEYISQQLDKTKLFWNLLVAPRYVSASDFFFYEYNNAYDPAHFAHATLVDKSGKKQFVALFEKNKTGWIEIITPDKATFVKTFGVDQPDSYFAEWQALVNLSGLNRFAVDESDLQGLWTSDFSSSLQYYNTYSGMYAGYNAFSSSVTFNFRNNRTYDWKLGMANSSNGQTQAESAESSGTFSMNGNWQLICSKIQKGPRTYNAHFTAIKGGRILWLQDVEYGSPTAFGKAAK